MRSDARKKLHPPTEARSCNIQHSPTGARCIKEIEEWHGPTHYGYAHYPGQLVSWPVENFEWPTEEQPA